jgi:hypothetical protein
VHRVSRLQVDELKAKSFLGLCSIFFLTSCARHTVHAHFGAAPSAGTTCNVKNASTPLGNGSLSGVVLDYTGAVLPGAVVSICSEGTVRTTQTSVQGSFAIKDIPPGVYSIFVDSPGFAKTSVNDLTVLPTQTASVKITLKAGEASSTVDVSSSNGTKATLEFPTFPINPPWASSRMQLPKLPMIHGNGVHLLAEYDKVLTTALDQFGYSDKGYYSYPGGFALATRLEQIKPDGEFLNPPDRFSKLPPPPKTFSFDYLRHIFIPRTGFFRIIVFIVTDQTIQESNVAAAESVAEGWPDHGVPGLPSKVAHTVADPDETINVYIYEFQNTTAGNVSDLTLLNPSTISPAIPLLDAEQHLRESHLWGAFGLP